MVYQHTFKINPVPASRPRVTRWGTYYSKTYLSFKDTMYAMVHVEVPKRLLEGCLHVETTFYKAVPKSYSKKRKTEIDGQFCISNVDNDNLEKALWDTLNGHLWGDDKQIVSNYTEKRWSVDNPRIELVVYQYKKTTQ